MQARRLLPLGVILLSLVSGCVGEPDETGWMTPTTELPDRTIKPPPAPRPDLQGPGYRMTGEWSVGDMWSYETTTYPIHWRQTTVKEKDVNTTTGAIRYELEEVVGFSNNEPASRAKIRVDGTNWTRLDSLDDQGTFIRYQPAMPIRYFNNGTWSYNETGTSTVGIGWQDSHLANSFYAKDERIQLPWGITTAGKIEVREIINGEKERRVLTTRWVDATYLNDVAIQIEEDTKITKYLLVGARVGGTTYGELRPR